MRMKEIFTAKSIEEAKHLAVEKFGVSEDQIVFRILEEPKKGIFGKVKREAQVEAVYEAAEEAAPAETTEAKAPEQPEAAGRSRTGNAGFPTGTGSGFFRGGDHY